MLIRKYREQFKTKLADLYDVHEVDQFFYMLLEEYHHLKRHELALDPTLELTDEQQSLWDFATSQLIQYKPIQYIIGKAYFYDGVFMVTPNTLIPRPETEELVDLIVKENLAPNKTVLDIGTGSGCIAISLAKNLNQASVSAIDVSEKAIEIAKHNAKSNSTSVNFILQDVLALQSLNVNYDIIVSNPPYVRNLEKVEIKNNVLDYEPHLALFVADDNPLLFYIKITELAIGALNPNGKLYFEINQYLGPETVQMIQSYSAFSEITLLKDIYGNDRMIKATRK
nr:peptide chain release factor N(5)-glutamine methyltransferase [uncultured Flavobacterium sp.]